MPSVQNRNLRFQIHIYIYTIYSIYNIYNNTYTQGPYCMLYVTRVLNTASSDFVFLLLKCRKKSLQVLWSCNPYKWPYKWVTGVITLLLGVIGPTLYTPQSISTETSIRWISTFLKFPRKQFPVPFFRGRAECPEFLVLFGAPRYSFPKRNDNILRYRYIIPFFQDSRYSIYQILEYDVLERWMSMS